MLAEIGASHQLRTTLEPIESIPPEILRGIAIGVLNHGELIYKDSIAETVRRFPDEASLEDIYARMEVAGA